MVLPVILNRGNSAGSCSGPSGNRQRGKLARRLTMCVPLLTVPIDAEYTEGLGVFEYMNAVRIFG